MTEITKVTTERYDGEGKLIEKLVTTTEKFINTDANPIKWVYPYYPQYYEPWKINDYKITCDCSGSILDKKV